MVRRSGSRRERRERRFGDDIENLGWVENDFGEKGSLQSRTKTILKCWKIDVWVWSGRKLNSRTSSLIDGGWCQCGLICGCDLDDRTANGKFADGLDGFI